MLHSEAARAPRSSAVRRAYDAADRYSERLERRGVALFAAVSALYAVVTLVLAARKLMWNDELYTYYIAVLPSMREVWDALLAGGEQTPPFFYVVTRTAFAVFGVNNLSMRLPQMLGFLGMSVCLLMFVRRRTSWFPALGAASFPLVTTAYYYAFEARPYGLVLGFTALALLSWQAVTLGRRPRLWLCCLATSLSAAVSSHYYAAFVILPLALGEATRSMASRRLDLRVWAAFAVPAIPLALHLPLIRAGQAYSGAFWAQPQWVNVPDFYFHLLAPALVVICVILAMAVLQAVLAPERASIGGRNAAEDTVPPPAAEIVAACGFIALPFVCVLAAKVATGAFTPRYALPAVLGFAVLAGFGTTAAFRRHALMRGVVVACLTAWFALSQARELIQPTALSLPVTSRTISRPTEWLTAAPGGALPLVVADPHTFTVLSHYGSPQLKARIVYLADPELALQQLGHNSVERGMLDLLKPWFRMNVVEFESFVAEHPQFLVYGDFFRTAFLNWITPELQRRGMRLELLNRAGDNLFLVASRSDRTPEPAVRR